MNEPIFLTLAEIEKLHRRGLEAHGGSEGVRDPGLVQSAVEQPKNIFYYGQGDLYEVAAGYAFHIAEAQAFLDGNKRTAISAAIVFLKVNGRAAHYEEDKLYDAMIAIAEGRLDRAGLAAIFREGDA